MGSRKSNLPLMIKLAQAGYVAVSVEYRLAPKYPFPAAIHDVKCAVRWLRANAEVFKIDPDRIAALGYSSGAHLAALVGITVPKDSIEGLNVHLDRSSRVQIVIGYYGIYDLTELYNNKNPLTRYSLIKFVGNSPAKDAASYALASP
jgi:acetyl esterase/lipase